MDFLDQLDTLVEIEQIKKGSNDHRETWLRKIMDLSENDFKARFRVRKTTFRELIDIVIFLDILFIFGSEIKNCNEIKKFD